MTESVVLSSLNAQRYAETFAVFLRRSLEYDLMVDELERIIHANLGRGIRLLDIGAGTGCVVGSLAARPAASVVQYTAYEPNPRHVEALRATLAALPLAATSLHPEGFGEDTPITGRFDLVLFSHSLYWMSDPAAVFLHAAEALDEGGVAVALIQGPYGAYALFNLFEGRYQRLTPMLQNNRLSSHELVAGLRARGVEPEVRILKTAIDLTGVFDPANAEELGELLSFLLQLEYRALPRVLRQDIVQYIEGGCVEQDGRLLWYLPNASVVVPRSVAENAVRP